MLPRRASLTRENSFCRNSVEMARPQESPKHRWAEWLVRQRVPLFLLACLISLAAWGPSSRLKFEESVEALYSANDPHLVAYEKSRKWFGGDELAFLAYTDPNLESEPSQAHLKNLSKKLAEVPGIDPASVQDYASALQGIQVPFITIPEEELKEMVRGVLLGEDNQTTGIVMRFLSESESPVSRAETIERLKRVAAENTFPTYLVGEPILVYESYRYVEEDGFWLWVYSAGLLMLVILILLRDLRWTLLPVLVVFASVLWTRGLIGVLGSNLSMVSSVLNSLITIVGAATVIHLALKYRELRESFPPEEALAKTIRELAVPIFWTTATTAMGFYVLVSSSISPVQTFGTMMTLGTLVVLPTIICLIPFGALLGENSRQIMPPSEDDWVARRMEGLSAWILSYPREIWMVSLVLIMVSITGFLFLTVETDFSKNFRSDTPIVKGLDYMETKLGGTGAWEVSFSAPEVLDYEYLNSVRALSEELETLRKESSLGLTKVIALSDAVDLIPRIPLVSFSLPKRMAILRRVQPELEASLYNAEAGRMRIVLRSLERLPSSRKIELMNEVREISRRHFPDAEVSGMYEILTYLIESLMFDQWLSFILAGIGIFVLTSIAFQSLWIGMISLVPNVFPIILVMGVMGWLGLPINMATAMIASVSMGLTVDSGIHYLSAFRTARRSGLSFEDSLHSAQKGVGKALLVANCALVAGFLVLTISHFIPLVYFGMLVSVAMLGGLIGNLVLLPLLMRSGRPEWCDGFQWGRKSEAT